LSICNKIYTFPRIIKSFADIVSSEEEEDTSAYEETRLNDGDKVYGFRKKDTNGFQHSKKKANDRTVN
jgi:hypothetical protein